MVQNGNGSIIGSDCEYVAESWALARPAFYQLPGISDRDAQTFIPALS